MNDHGFPWRRFEAAQEYLYALKPWWRRFGQRVTWVPIENPPPPGHPYGASTHVESTFRVFVDRDFAANAPLHVLSGAIEHDLQLLVRKTHSRLTHLPDSKRVNRNVAFELEVNSAIHEEARSNGLDVFDMQHMSRLLINSHYFTKSDLADWSVTSWPNIGKHSFLPSQFGFPELLSAEDYYRLIENPEHFNEQDEPPPEASLGAESDQQEPNKGEEELDVEDSGESAGTSDEDQASETVSEDSPDSDSSGGNESESDQQSDSEAGAGDNSQSGEESDSPTEQQEQDQASGSGSSEAEAAQVIQDMTFSDPVMDWLAQDHEIEDSSDDPVPDEYEVEMALQEAADDLEESSESSGFGLKPGSATMKWTEIHLNKKSKSWDRRLISMISSQITSSMMIGSSDFSYSVRNPNQPEVGPILMGMHEYAPTVYVVVDVSASMMYVMGSAASALRDIARAIYSRYSVKIVWITIDTRIQNIGTTLNVDTRVLRKLGAGGLGGTSLFNILSRTVEGDLWWEGRRYRKPDILIIVTDCGFIWPWARKAPSGVKVIVASTETIESVTTSRTRNDFPAWIRPRRGNFVYIR